MKILVVNSGSSSLKFTMFDMETEEALCKGTVERIGMDAPDMIYQRGDEPKTTEPLSIQNHAEALKAVCEKLVDPVSGVLKSLKEVEAIGHRVLHGGAEFTRPIVVNQEVKEGIRKCFVWGPLHNPANLGGIEACEEVFPGVPNVAVFDTAFHQSMDPEAYLYAIPQEYTKKYGIRKYGFHGTSHKYVYYKTCEFLGLNPETARVLSCHLGNGSSLCAIQGGKVLDTSMGLTPLMGLVMGTRCGDMDPAVVPFLMKQAGLSAEQMDTIMNKKSGLLGVSGFSSDMRDIEKARDEGNEDAATAYKMFLHRLIHYIGGYYLLLGGADAVVFTGGIGENGIATRAAIMKQMEVFGCLPDLEANNCRGKQVIITKPGSRPLCVVTPTNEELMIAKETLALTK